MLSVPLTRLVKVSDELSIMIRHLVVEAKPIQLSTLTHFAALAAEDAGFAPQQRDRIELVMDEACSNIIEHAYAGRPGTIDAYVEIRPNCELVIKLIDQGKSFEPESVARYLPQAEPANIKIGGLGLFLMRKVMDEVKFEFNIPGIGNRLTMVKRI